MNVNFIESEEGNMKIPEFTWVRGNTLLKPVWFRGKRDEQEEEDLNMSHWSYGGKGYKKLEGFFLGEKLTLYTIWCRDYNFVVGGGTIIYREGSNYIPLILFCEDENDRLTCLINNKISAYKKVHGIVKKYLKTLPETIDVIYTNNPGMYCFPHTPKVKFSSFTEQRSYYQHIADEWLKQQKGKSEVLTLN